MLCALLASALFVPAAVAQGGDCQSAPGRSSIDEYCETVPGATGPESPSRDPAGGGSFGGSGGGGGGGLATLTVAGTSTLIDGSGNVSGLPTFEPPGASAQGEGDVGPISGSALLWILLGVAALLVLLWYLRRIRQTRPPDLGPPSELSSP